MKRKFTSHGRLCNCTRQDGEAAVRSGLAMTPSQIKELTDKGIPVNIANGQFLDTDTTSTWDIEPMFKREMDINTLWETQKSAQSKVVGAHKKNKKQFG